MKESTGPDAATGVRGGLQRREVSAVLDRLHTAARGDWWRFPGLVPRVVTGWLRGRSFAEAISPEAMKTFYIPVSRLEGQFLYLTARAIRAQRVVEFGTSFGISTIYLAEAVRENGGGFVIGTEIEPSKHARATAHLGEAGLDGIAEVRLGDALETLRAVEGPLDLVFLDGWKDLYLPVLQLLQPRLRRGAVVLADNIHTFRKSLRPYVSYVQSGDNGFESTTLSISDGLEYSIYTSGPS